MIIESAFVRSLWWIIPFIAFAVLGAIELYQDITTHIKAGRHPEKG